MSEFETVAPVEPREIRQRLFEKANESYPIVRQPTLGFFRTRTSQHDVL